MYKTRCNKSCHRRTLHPLRAHYCHIVKNRKILVVWQAVVAMEVALVLEGGALRSMSEKVEKVQWS